MSKTWSCQPSDILRVEDPVTAFYLDRAVFTFGSKLDQEIDEIQNGSKKRTVAQKRMALNTLLGKWLGISRFANVRRG